MKKIAIIFGVMFLVVMGWAGSSNAQTLTTLYSFCADTNGFYCADGNDPGDLILGSDGNIYGDTDSGGSNDFGTTFKMTTEGTLTTIFEASSISNEEPSLSLESNGILYGIFSTGGTNHDGAIFSMTTDGTITLLHQFSGTNGVADGQFPERLIQGSGDIFYGTTLIGGSNDQGTVFSITSEGAFTMLHVFSGTNGVADGEGPLLSFLSGGALVGSTITGGTFSAGTVFQMTPGGTFTTLHQFNATNDGSEPIIVPLKDGANFIGTTIRGGSNDAGTAFLMTDQGTVTTFYQFSGTNGAAQGGDSSELAPLQDSTGAFYGLTHDGGTNHQGLIFTLTTAGTLTPVYQFCGTNCLDGGSPHSFVLGGGTTVYGATDSGGTYGAGTIFKLVVGSGTGGGTGSCTYALGSTSASPSAAGGAATVSVIASNSCTWTAASNDGFISITSGSTGSGNGTVHYTVSANTSSNAQVGTMTIAGETFTVTESGTTSSSSGCSYTLNAASVKLTAKGGAETVSVKTEAGCAWTATTGASFITISSGSTGKGNGTVKFTVPGNTSTMGLTGTITIADLAFIVVQDSGGCSFALSPKDAKFKDTGGSGTVKVTPNFTNCDWTAVSSDPFITITSGASEIGRGTVRYTVATNATTEALTGSIMIGDQTFEVTEAAAPCEISLSETNASFSSAEASSNVIVTANGTTCPWKAVVSGSFITIISGGSGPGNGMIDYTVAANTKTATRKGTITVGKEKLTITQSGVAP
jgi:uncharacterized repeat protein (TIGR03803 family)